MDLGKRGEGETGRSGGRGHFGWDLINERRINFKKESIMEENIFNTIMKQKN